MYCFTFIDFILLKKPDVAPINHNTPGITHSTGCKSEIIVKNNN